MKMKIAISQNGFFHLSLLLNITFVLIELESCAWSQKAQFCLFFKIHNQTANISPCIIKMRRLRGGLLRRGKMSAWCHKNTG